MTKVKFEIYGDHTMQHIKAKIPQFESALEKILKELGHTDLQVHGNICRAVLGTHFIAEKEISIKSAIDYTNGSFLINLYPQGMGNTNSILVRLFIEDTEKVQEVYDDILAAKQPQIYSAYRTGKHISSPDNQGVEFDPTAWVLRSMRFSCDLDNILQDEAALFNILDDTRTACNQSLEGHITYEDFLQIIIATCGHVCENYDNELNDTVIGYLEDVIVKKLIDQNFIATKHHKENYVIYLKQKAKELVAKEWINNSPMDAFKNSANEVIKETTAKITDFNQKISTIEDQVGQIIAKTEEHLVAIEALNQQKLELVTKKDELWREKQQFEEKENKIKEILETIAKATEELQLVISQ